MKLSTMAKKPVTFGHMMLFCYLIVMVIVNVTTADRFRAMAISELGLEDDG